jgi:hypothetical protein
MIRGDGVRLDSRWTELLANDYRDPRYHISFARAIGRRLRRTYACMRGLLPERSRVTPSYHLTQAARLRYYHS